MLELPERDDHKPLWWEHLHEQRRRVAWSWSVPLSGALTKTVNVPLPTIGWRAF